MRQKENPRRVCDHTTIVQADWEGSEAPVREEPPLKLRRSKLRFHKTDKRINFKPESS